MVARALGEAGFRNFLEEYGTRDAYSLSANQSEAIVSMQLGSLANLERENLQAEHHSLLERIAGYRALLSDEANIRAVIKEEMAELKRKFPDKRRTDITDDELEDVDKDELITEEPMVVTLSQRGYIKRLPLKTYQAQNRGGKGIMGTKSDEEDPIEHLFVSSTHAYLLFFTNLGKVYWQKVYDLPQQGRTAKGRALVNLLSLAEGEKVQDCIDVRVFDDNHFLLMATRGGIVKKTALTAYGRPMKRGIIAIKLEEGDALIDVVKVAAGQDVVICTAKGMSIRFTESDARSLGRDSRGVRGINLATGDEVVGMVVADPEGSLLTICEHGYGKRTPFGQGELEGEDAAEATGETEEPVGEPDSQEAELEVATEAGEGESPIDVEAGPETRSGMRYRRQRRGGKGLRDIKTTERNGRVVGILALHDSDDVLMVSTSGKIQRIRAADIRPIGRNTQGVRIMSLEEGEVLTSLARIPAEVV